MPVYDDTDYEEGVEISQEIETQDSKPSHPLYSLLQMRDYLGETPLHSFRVHADTVNYLTSSLTNEQWYSLLQITDVRMGVYPSSAWTIRSSDPAPG